MRRFIIGAVALVTGLLAAGGVALTTRRRRDRDEVLPLDVAPPLGAGEPEDIAHASVEADFGSTVAAAEAEVPVAPKRKRVRRKPAKAATAEASSTDGASTAESADGASAADPTDAVTTNEAPSSSASADDPASAPAAATASDPAPAATPGARTAEAAEAAAAAEAAELSGSPELPSAP